MKTIYKYPLEITDEQTVSMPANAYFLSAMVQHNQPVVYAEVDTSNPFVDQKFHIYGTGNPIPEHDELDNYIGTVTTHDGRFVWHVFYVTDMPF